MSKTGKNVLGFLALMAVLFLIFGWDFYHPYLSQWLKPKASHQQYIVFVGDNIYLDTSNGQRKNTIRKDIMIANVENRERVILPVPPMDELNSRVAVSPEGKIFYISKTDYQLHKFDLQTMTDLQALQLPRICLNPACSGNGRFVFLEANMTNKAGYRDIYAFDQRSLANVMQKLTNSLTFCGSPSCSAKNKYIVFDCCDAASVGLWIMDFNGGNQRCLLAGGPNGNLQRPACSPTSDWVAYQINIGGAVGISASLLDRNQNVCRTVTVVMPTGENLNPSWSPDGRYLLFQKKKSTVISQVVDGAIKESVYDNYDVYSVEFNPDLIQTPVPVITRDLLGSQDACWLPLLGDSVQNSIDRLFIRSRQKILPGA